MAVHMCTQMHCTVVYVHNSYICKHTCIIATHTYIQVIHIGIYAHLHIFVLHNTHTQVCTHICMYVHAHILYPFSQMRFRIYTCTQMYVYVLIICSLQATTSSVDLSWEPL